MEHRDGVFQLDRLLELLPRLFQFPLGQEGPAQEEIAVGRLGDHILQLAELFQGQIVFPLDIVDISQVSICLVRSQVLRVGQRLAKGVNGGVPHLLPDVGRAEVIESVGQAGLQLDGPPESLNRLVNLLVAEEGIAQGMEVSGVAGILFYRDPELVDGFAEVVLGERAESDVIV